MNEKEEKAVPAAEASPENKESKAEEKKAVKAEKPAAHEKKTAKARKAEPLKDTKAISKASVRDYDLIIKPIITEKTMKLIQESNKVTVKVPRNANRADVKKAFERVFGVPVDAVNIINYRAKKTRRGGRYPGHISGGKKAIVTVRSGEAIDLFKE